MGTEFTPTTTTNYTPPRVNGSGDSGSRPQGTSQQDYAAQVLAEISREITCILDQNGDPYIRVHERGRFRLIEGTKDNIRGWLTEKFLTKTGQHPPAKATGTLVDATLARCASCVKTQVDYRITRIEDYCGLPAICMDRGADDWGAILVTPDGITYEHPSPVPFRRSEGMRDLPIPPEESPEISVMELLQEVAPLPEKDQEILRLGFILACLWPSGPYPILNLVGPPECGKGFQAKIIRDLVDPVQAIFQGFPFHEAELMLDAYNERLLVLDNVTAAPPYAFNALCRISTGGSLKKKRLYADKTRVAVHVCNPVIITSTERILTTPDLVARSILIELPRIPDEGRWDEAKALDKFRAARPLIFRKLLELIQVGLTFDGQVRRQSRITPMFRLMTAAERALGWVEGTFERAYYRNRSMGHDSIIAEYPYITAIRDILQERAEAIRDGNLTTNPAWEGTAKDLLEEIRKRVGPHLRGPQWPSTERMLLSQLKQVEASLHDTGYQITWNTRRVRMGQQFRIERSQR